MVSFLVFCLLSITGNRIDIAILQSGKPVALIEAKAAMSFDLVKGGKQPFSIKAVLNDIEKLRGIEFVGTASSANTFGADAVPDVGVPATAFDIPPQGTLWHSRATSVGSATASSNRLESAAFWKCKH